MSKNEDGMPTIISVDELAEKTARKLEEKMKPAERTNALTEPTEPEANYNKTRGNDTRQKQQLELDRQP